MKRPLSLVLAGVLAASTIAVGAVPVAAQGVEFGVGNWNNDRWHSDRSWRHDRHLRHRDRGPGFSFSFGVPGPRAYYRPHYRDRDCWRDYYGGLVCRY